jgi:hypothetical protein
LRRSRGCTTTVAPILDKGVVSYHEQGTDVRMGCGRQCTITYFILNPDERIVTRNNGKMMILSTYPATPPSANFSLGVAIE